MERPNTKKLLPFAKDMRKAPSDAERRLWQRLRNRQLDGLKFRRQAPVGPFIADFAFDERKLIVELDGKQHDDHVEYDKDRTKWLNANGWRVLRFYAGDVMRSIDAVLQAISFAARPHPNPLP